MLAMEPRYGMASKVGLDWDAASAAEGGDDGGMGMYAPPLAVGLDDAVKSLRR